MIFEDDRKPEHMGQLLVVMTDKFLSGWGEAKGGKSVCAWSVPDEHLNTVFNWVDSRSDASRVRVCKPDYKPRNAKHFHIYVAKQGIHFLTHLKGEE